MVCSLSGYTVGMFGKYLNNVPKFVPPGFDAWLANGGGDYLSPEFSTYNVDGLPNGTWKGVGEQQCAPLATTRASRSSALF